MKVLSIIETESLRLLSFIGVLFYSMMIDCRLLKRYFFLYVRSYFSLLLLLILKVIRTAHLT
jgi:hypothetical protein